MKRSLCFFISLMLLSSLAAGCKQSNGLKLQNVDSMVEKPVTLSMYSEDVILYNDDFKSPVAKNITKKTGVILKYEQTLDDSGEKVGLMIAANEYPDLMFVKGTSLNQLIEANALVNLKPLIEKYGPNIKKLYGTYLSRLEHSAGDDSIYTLSSTPVGSEKLEPVMGFQLQHAVVKELGFPKIETVQDFENALKAYKEKYPTIEAKPTIALSLLADDWRWNISIGNGAGFATGAPDDGNWYINPETYEASYRFTRPEEKEYFRWLNHMNDIGLLDPDSFVQKYDQYLAKIASGRVLGLIDAKWEYADGENNLKSQGNFERTYGMYPVQLNKTFKSAEFRDAGYSGGWGIGISTSCKDPEKAIKFLDWMSTDEAHILRYWGVEGINYKVENDKRVIPDEELSKKTTDKDYQRNTGIGAYTYPFPTWGVGKKDASGQLYIPTSKSDIIEGYSSIEKEVLNNYGKNTWAELYPSKDQFEESPWGLGYQINIPADSDLALTVKKLNDTMQADLPKVILIKPSEFDKAWEELMKKLEYKGAEKAGKDFTELVKKQVELLK
jgi:putative aldouronate transport system substrate-binding protein